MKLPLTPIRCLLRAAQEYPDKVGVVDGDVRLTYAELLDRTRRLAGALAAIGVKPGDRVASLSFNCHQLLELYYGAPMAHAALLSLNVRLAPEEQAFILDHSGSSTVLFDVELTPLVEKLRATLPGVRWISLTAEPGLPDWVEGDYETLLAQAEPASADYLQYDEDSIAELFYTSGSTGMPKGVMLSHRALYLHALGVLLGYLRLGDALPADRKVELHTIPLFHANGWGRPHTVTMMGARHVMVKRFDPELVCRLIEDEGVTSFSMVPTMAATMVHFDGLERYDLSSLEEITLGGAASTPSLVAAVERSFGCPCFAGYGLTESGPVSTSAHLKETFDGISDEQRFERQAMTGWAMPGAEVRVADDNGVDVPRDMKSIGEVLIRADAAMDGYWNEPEATRTALEPDGWLHTGDMAVWDEQRYLLIVDRKKDIIISGGENISSLEIERALASHPSIYECAVIGVPDDKWGETPKAFVTLKPGAAADEAELRAHVREHLAGFKVPASIEFCDALPKGATGKILKREIRDRYWQGRAKQVQGAGGD